MKYETRVVAFIDLLGFKQAIDKSNADQAEFERILRTLTELKEFFCQPKDEYDKAADAALNADTQIIQVSDSLVISRLVHEEGGIFEMLTDCAFAIHLLIAHGFLCRGAIKVGNMYHKDTTLFGPAFVDAYLTESQEEMPIIKFDAELFDIARSFPGEANKYDPDWAVQFIKRNCKEIQTDVYYLDYFTDYDNRVGGGEGTASMHYFKLREIIVEGLQITRGKKAFEKYRWAATQFNLSARGFGLEDIEVTDL